VQGIQDDGKVLARVPEGSNYRPDPKSRTAREIAWQIVGEEKMLIEAIETGTVMWAPTPPPETMKALCEIYDRQSADMARRWQALSAARWEGALDFFGSTRQASPMAWSFLFDIVHHRGQITTYLRRWDRPCRRSTAPAPTSLKRQADAG